MKSLRRATGILWIIGGALIGLAYAFIAQQPLAAIYWLVAIADVAILLGLVGAALTIRRLPIRIGFLVSGVGWLLLAIVALVSFDRSVVQGLLAFGQDLAVAGIVVAAIAGLVLQRSRYILVALALSTLIYFYVAGVLTVVFAAVLVVVGVIVARRGFVGR
jgi:hypothetical protein